MTVKEREFEELIAKHIKCLNCTREEAIDIIETDKIIDKGGRTQYDLSIEAEKEAIKIGRVDERKSTKADNMRGKVRAENPTKEGLIQFLFEALCVDDNIEKLEVVNKTKLITFSMNGENFELDLKQKRKKKGE